MALKDIWEDLKNAIVGVPNSGDDISADTINDIAHAVIDLENKPIADVVEKGNVNPITSNAVADALKNIDISGDLALVATSGSYNDLTNKPITILTGYPDTDEELNELIDGVYYFMAGETTPYGSIIVICSTTETWKSVENNIYYKEFKYSQIIITIDGIRHRQKIKKQQFDDHREDVVIEWHDVPLNDDLATKEYVNSAIGDVETSLENIIEKYGLGGESE